MPIQLYNNLFRIKEATSVKEDKLELLEDLLESKPNVECKVEKNDVGCWKLDDGGALDFRTGSCFKSLDMVNDDFHGIDNAMNENSRKDLFPNESQQALILNDKVQFQAGHFEPSKQDKGRQA
ncbi:hypothetical protein Gohar_021524, partial [Gossypium harknessii]|nr:hypothetical protein [Gossypium harknessii]